MKIRKFLTTFAAFALIATSASAATVTKSPNQGDNWSPLSNGGTYIYANSFVAPTSGSVTGLGTWLNSRGSQGSDLVFQIFGSIGGNSSNGPDSSIVYATSGVLSGLTLNSLTFVDGGSISSLISLLAGETYWFAASTVNLGGGSGRYNVGGHTQNSEGIVDGGSFWYSNDRTGVNFDGRGLTPEMAFSVTIGDNQQVPEPGSLALLSIALLGAVAAKSRKKASQR